jgi:hypothetical protein
MKFIDMIFNFEEEQVTQEQINERQKKRIKRGETLILE